MKAVRSALLSVSLYIGLSGTDSATIALAQIQAAGSQASSQTVEASNAKAAKAPNRVLRKVVIRQLSRTRGLNVDGINVVAEDGIVTLLGTVPDTHQIDLATDATRDMAGVREVRNSLTLQTNGK
ncbi:BON domain-containing protein [Paraburkholderia sp. RL17-337-BIB-A]|uniref:BON domain-containing protein n=1 Tax=Paraburkholderia sp. RL17-337-BIB-A TaxID=3031636 RepID=UPI0038BC618D